jgi:uncharacterized protein
MSDTATKPKQGTFCWVELMTRDAAKARAFYSKLIGWKTSEMDMGPAGTYTMWTPEGQEESVGGMMEMNDRQFEGIPPHWMPYIAVDDIHATAGKVEALGGSIKVPVMPIPGIGYFCVIEDPTGAVISLYMTDTTAQGGGDCGCGG